MKKVSIFRLYNLFRLNIVNVPSGCLFNDAKGYLVCRYFANMICHAYTFMCKGDYSLFICFMTLKHDYNPSSLPRFSGVDCFEYPDVCNLGGFDGVFVPISLPSIGILSNIPIYQIGTLSFFFQKFPFDKPFLKENPRGRSVLCGIHQSHCLCGKGVHIYETFL